MSSLPVAHLRFSTPTRPFPYANERSLQLPLSLSFAPNLSLRCRPLGISSARLAFAGGNGNNGDGHSGGGGRGGENGGWGEDDDSESNSNSSENGVRIAWRERVEADPQFPYFKVLMEELIGISACVLGDMACRPNFDFRQLDFVFSTLIIGSILDSILMVYYFLVPPTSISTIFANCPKNHILVAAGFASGLVGTAISNRLIRMGKKIDTDCEPPNYPRSPVLNALTWAIHIGISSNLRYRVFTGITGLLSKSVPPLAFNTSVLALRCLNGVFGGMSFVMLVNLIKLMEKDERIKEREREMNFKLSEERRMTFKLSPLNPFFSLWSNEQFRKGQILRSAGFNVLMCSMLFSHKITEHEETDL